MSSIPSGGLVYGKPSQILDMMIEIYDYPAPSDSMTEHQREDSIDEWTTAPFWEVNKAGRSIEGNETKVSASETSIVWTMNLPPHSPLATFASHPTCAQCLSDW
jgi:hypothetical protein